MKNMILSFTLLSSIGLSCGAQNKVSEKELIGTWKMVLVDLEAGKEKWNEKDRSEKRDDVAGRFENAIGMAAIAFVGELLDGLEIHFTFRKDHIVVLDVLGVDGAESEELKWEINSKGQLIIFDEDGPDDEVWLLEEDKLVQYESKNGKLTREDDTYLVRVK